MTIGIIVESRIFVITILSMPSRYPLTRRLAVSALAIGVCLIGGCRTNSRLANLFSHPIGQPPCLTLDNLAPNLSRGITRQQKRFVEHWTTGGSAIPCESSCTLDNALQVRGDCIAASASMIPGELDPVIADLPVGFAGQPELPIEIDEASIAEAEEYPITLTEAIRLGLSNSSVIRTDADFVAGSSDLLRTPDLVRSADDVAIRQTGYLFGQRGEAAALSDFDTRFDWATVWNRNETIQNNTFLSGGILPGGTLVEETANFRMGLSKSLAQWRPRVDRSDLGLLGNESPRRAVHIGVPRQSCC